MSDLRTILYDDSSRQYKIDPDWQGTIPYWLTPERLVTVAVGANAPVVVPLPLRHDGIFRGEYILIRPTGDFVMVMSGDGGYRFNNNDVPVFGPLVASQLAGRPFVLPEAIMLDFNRMVSMLITDTSGAPNNFNIALPGLLYLPVRFGTGQLVKRLQTEQERYNWLRPHWAAPDGNGLGISVPNVAGGGQIDFQITIDQTGFFEVSKIGLAAATGSALTNISMRLFEPGDRSLSQFQMHAALWGGTAEYPYIIPVKWGLMPNSMVRGTLFNTGVVAQTVYLALIGRRLLGNVQTV